MKRNATILGTILLISILSGCIGQQQTLAEDVYGDYENIKYPSEVTPSDQFYIEWDVKNIGFAGGIWTRLYKNDVGIFEQSYYLERFESVHVMRFMQLTATSEFSIAVGHTVGSQQVVDGHFEFTIYRIPDIIQHTISIYVYDYEDGPAVEGKTVYLYDGNLKVDEDVTDSEGFTSFVRDQRTYGLYTIWVDSQSKHITLTGDKTVIFYIGEKPDIPIAESGDSVTPGFEILTLAVALGLVGIVMKRRRDRKVKL